MKNNGNDTKGYKIETGIEIPKRYYEMRIKYPFKELKKFQSFFVIKPEDKTINALRSALIGCARHQSVKITTRQMDGGIRVWRVA